MILSTGSVAPSRKIGTSGNPGASAGIQGIFSVEPGLGFVENLYRVFTLVPSRLVCLAVYEEDDSSCLLVVPVRCLRCSFEDSSSPCRYRYGMSG